MCFAVCAKCVMSGRVCVGGVPAVGAQRMAAQVCVVRCAVGMGCCGRVTGHGVLSGSVVWCGDYCRYDVP
jgi:hypothetical protein